MSRRAKGPRLWLRPVRRDSDGRITHESAWFILDGGRQIGTGCSAGDPVGAERALQSYIGAKHTAAVTSGTRDPSQILIDDVLALYVRDKVVTRTTTLRKAAKSRLKFLSAYWSGKTLDKVTGPECRAYVRQRGHTIAARRELEDLRAAINHHRQEGLHNRIVSVVLPDRSTPRERWLTRSEAAKLILTAWRHKVAAGNGAERHPRKHIARWMIVARYMGSRASVICSASIEINRPTGRAWIDLTHGVFYGRPVGERETTKRKQTVRIPRALLAHLRRWKTAGQRYVVEWNGRPVASVKKGHAAAVADAGLGSDVVQHTWRHSLATWLMQDGGDEHKIADYLAMDVRTLRRVYGHHHPENSAEVLEIFDARRRQSLAVSLAAKSGDQSKSLI